MQPIQPNLQAGVHIPSEHNHSSRLPLSRYFTHAEQLAGVFSLKKGTMITKEITICGKQVTLAYCYATEIAYKDLSDEDMFDYAQHAVEAIQAQRDPDIKKTILAIIACMMAYYEDADKAPVKDTDIMKTATPVELGTAMLTILSMRSEFYHTNDEPEEKTDGEGTTGKNA